jgi:integrase
MKQNLKSLRVKPNHFKTLQGTTKIQRNGWFSYTIRNNRDRFFFPDEWMVFYDELTDKQKITFEFLINTGARIMEIQNIKVSDVDFERRGIVLRVTKRVLKRIKKGATGERRIRLVNVSSEFIRFIRRVVNKYKLKQDDYFPILSTPAANIGMKKALRKASIGDWEMFSLHNVRKTLETWLMALGVDSFNLTKHFGHSVAVALKHYVSPDIFNWEEKEQMRKIVGDLYKRNI